ncbi:MAG: PSD1 and planctomycete cytochrome C domain-containing protein [Planctomycetota bacterium]|nr:PSD1 and planctomycete cytochrome C domain-containing protein [Planctomycetota bacterium]
MHNPRSLAAKLPNLLVGKQTSILLLVTAWVCMPGASWLAAEETAIDFSRDILPLLSENCFKCHGPDEANREAGLRLDQREGALAKLESDETAVVPGKSDASAVYRRITSDDPDQRMPPPDSGKTLSPAEIARIKAWIDGGAEWSRHWAFETPHKPAVPDQVAGWHSENAIDLFIQARLHEAKLQPEAPADKATLIRRATLDLTGLPPTVKEVDDFLADDSPLAFERVVDRLLESHRYGEHIGRIWLDAARFADTHGLHLDNERSIWPYRDWVIDAFNRNMPFDQFTIEQLAGDLLPSATLAQRVATGFNRCNVTTSEGGSIDDEYYMRYAVDRVETTSTVWLGLTAGCAACHDHKFDPLTQKEFYQLFSYFFSLTEKAMDGNALLPPPAVKVPSPTQLADQKRLTEQLASVRSEIETAIADWKYVDPLADAAAAPLEQQDKVWFDDALPEGAKPAGNDADPWKFVSAPDHPVFSGENSSVRTGNGLTQHFFTEATEPLMISANDRLFAYVYLDPANPPETVQLQFNDGSWEHRAFWGADKGHGAGRNNPSNLRLGDLPEAGKWVRLEVPSAAVGLNEGAKLNGWAFTQFSGTVHWDKAGIVTIAPLSREQQESLAAWEHFRVTVKYPALPEEVQKILDVEKEKRSAEQTQQLTRYYLQHVNPTSRERFAEPLKQQAAWEKELADVEQAIPSTLVMEERPEPRQAHILERGQYTLQREPVSSRVPEWLGTALPEAPANRLGLAQWLVSPTHPLTARVTVNRFWQHYFGTGLVKTAEDFGIQGEHPSHPQLLDWLAVDFVESGWDVKRLQKMLVMSATYRQSSRVSPEKLAADPQNRLLSRGPRFRLDAEVIRDQALALSGLLVDKIGGQSVRPYQPAGLWKPVGFGGSNTSVFVQDTGSKLYRRSMYTFWKRTSPPPTMTTFDAPDRETCQVRRARTNTPLQALVLMNDVQFIEAARKFAERVMNEGGSDVGQRVTFAFRTVLARQPSSSELDSLTQLFNDYQAEFKEHPDSATKLLAAGESPRNESLDASELGAWTMVAHLLLNLSETVTKG